MTSHQLADLLEAWEKTLRKAAFHASSDDKFSVYTMLANMFETTAHEMRQHPEV